MPPYSASFPEGTRTQIAALPTLAEFQRSWKFHHPLQPDQLAYAGKVSVVERVGYYHGGDALYWLEGLPGVWHECCLIEAPGPTST